MTARQLKALRWLIVNEGTPLIAGHAGNVAKDGTSVRFHARTLLSLADRGLVRKSIGNDGDCWYWLTDAGREIGGAA